MKHAYAMHDDHLPRTLLAAFCVLGIGALAGVSAQAEAEAAERPPLHAYVIYHDADAPPSVAHAARELRAHIALALGRELAIVHAPATPMIALGDTAASRAAGLATADLPWEAARIATRGANLFIAGRDLPDDAHTPQGGRSYGTLYGAYAFLEQGVGVRWLMPGEHGTHVPVNPDLTLPELDWVEQPGMAFRQLSGICNVLTDWYTRHRFDQNVPFDHPRPIPPPFPATGLSGVGGSLAFSGFRSDWDMLFPAPGRPEAADYPDREQTFRDHPEYFALDAQGRRIAPHQTLALCLSNPELAAEVARRAGIRFDQSGTRNLDIFPRWQVPPVCHCAACRALSPDAESLAGPVWTAAMVAYVERVARILAQTHPGRTVSVGCYLPDVQKPDALAPLPENVLGYLNPVRVVRPPQRLNEAANARWHALLASWKTRLPNMIYYGIDFWLRDFSGAPNAISLGMLGDTFETLRHLNYRGAYFSGSLGYGKASLLNYMLAKLLWDPSRSPQELFHEFCDAAYGPGSDSVKAIYRLVDRNMRDFVQQHENDAIDLHLYPEMLRGVYARGWSQLEQHYHEAWGLQLCPAIRWRLAQLGENLKLLNYHLTRLRMIETDTASPLFLSDDQYRDQIPAKRVAPWPVPPPPAVPNLKSVIAPQLIRRDVPAPSAPASVPSFALRYPQRLLIAPDRNGIVTVSISPSSPRISPVTGEPWLPDIPYYVLYDADGRWMTSGIAAGGDTIRFEGTSGSHYVLALLGMGRAGSDTRFGLDIDAPWALGDRMDSGGLRFEGCPPPLYFFVPPLADAFELVFDGLFSAEILDPTGQVALRLEGTDTRRAVVATQALCGRFWSVRFQQAENVRVRQEPPLSGYFTVDPIRALAVIKAADD